MGKTWMPEQPKKKNLLHHRHVHVTALRAFLVAFRRPPCLMEALFFTVLVADNSVVA
jgi:hypothetical protein